MNHSFQKSVLVTGASSGIGQATARYLAKVGYTVLASVRKQEDADKINELGLTNLKPLYPLDLTRPEQIKTSTQRITALISKKECPPLYSIINVAGGGQIAPIELMNIVHFRDELEKRLVGPVTLLQQLLPLLRQTKGKILWISTPGLFPVPYVADIHAPDFAVNDMARTLNLELRPDGISNILIRCGGIDTGSSQRTEEHLIDMFRIWPKEKLAIYEDRLIKVLQDLKKFNAKRTAPEKVAELIVKVLLAKHPRVRYSIGYLSGAGGFLEKLPQSWVDDLMGKREG